MGRELTLDEIARAQKGVQDFINEHRETLTQTRARYNRVFWARCDEPPQPYHGESRLNYLRRVSSILKRDLPAYADMDLLELDGEALEKTCEGIRADAGKLARKVPESRPELREIIKRENGRDVSYFEGPGNTTFIDEFRSPKQRVIAIRLDSDLASSKVAVFTGEQK